MTQEGKVVFGSNSDQLSKAIGELSERLEKLSNMADDLENIKLTKYKADGIMLEFTLVTGGLVIGTIVWISDRSIGVKMESGQSMILYKHAIAFIQEQEKKEK